MNMIKDLWWWGIRYKFFETFGERDYLRTIPTHGDWEEEPGWWFKGKFYKVFP